jgi:hypothetical protein
VSKAPAILLSHGGIVTQGWIKLGYGNPHPLIGGKHFGQRLGSIANDPLGSIRLNRWMRLKIGHSRELPFNDKLAKL